MKRALGRKGMARLAEAFKSLFGVNIGIAESPSDGNIAKLDIGVNDRATTPDNILDAEKILGAIQISPGDNSCFGGTVSTPFHEDDVFCRPTPKGAFTDGSEKPLLLDGKPVFTDHGARK